MKSKAEHAMIEKQIPATEEHEMDCFCFSCAATRKDARRLAYYEAHKNHLMSLNVDQYRCENVISCATDFWCYRIGTKGQVCHASLIRVHVSRNEREAGRTSTILSAGIQKELLSNA